MRLLVAMKAQHCVIAVTRRHTCFRFFTMKFSRFGRQERHGVLFEHPASSTCLLPFLRALAVRARSWLTRQRSVIEGGKLVLETGQFETPF